MHKARPFSPICSLLRCLPIASVVILLQCGATAGRSQTAITPSAVARDADLILPEAPRPALSGYAGRESSSLEEAALSPAVGQVISNPLTHIGPRAQTSQPISPTDLTVLPGETAPGQTVRDKMIGSVKDSISPFSLIGETISAGYSQARNGSPNFGTDVPAFGQRLGASLARGTSQKIFNEGVLAAALREDPRYYQMGRRKPFFERLVYAGTRPLISRTDSGRTTPNLALLGGYLGAAALTKTYYPPLNQGFSQTLQTYGNSLGGSALGYVVSEFLSDVLPVLHLETRN